MKSTSKNFLLSFTTSLLIILFLVQCNVNYKSPNDQPIGDCCKERLRLNPILIDATALKQLIGYRYSTKTDPITEEEKDRIITEYLRRRDIINNRTPQGLPGGRNFLYNDSTNYLKFNVFKILYEMAKLKNKPIEEMTLDDWQNIKLNIHFANYGANPPDSVGVRGKHQNTMVLEISTSNENLPSVTSPATTFINLGDLCPPCPDGGD